MTTFLLFVGAAGCVGLGWLGGVVCTLLMVVDFDRNEVSS